MDTISCIKVILLVIQWFALGLEIGYFRTIEAYERFIKLTEDIKTIDYLWKKINNAKIVITVCFAVVIFILVINLCL